MIEYIVNTSQGALIYQERHIKTYKSSNLSYIKLLCQEGLFTYEGYLMAVKKVLDIKYKVPVYINDYLMLIPVKRTRDYDNIWINYASINHIRESDDGLEIEFYSQRKIYLKYSLNSLSKQIKYLEMIKFMKVKHFHFQ
ncbi:competence protein ComK [Peloplasma aerotolerans]|uniref:Competence protein ComK n=1 Tax=Peloplasma aerotolerans TaxID=3044389 RepID=A0AAW6UBQ5_9MOLU|nr:competence protein ComK [Mariniplasma sp. M4Ah]MDI6452941.1 competence protein ComK [Mariniplasma sp. M4Ah]